MQACAHTFLCIGAINVDRKYRVQVECRPATSNPVSLITERPGGVARNVAENLARMGHRTALMAWIGRDAAGRELLAHARRAGIDTAACLRGPKGSTSSTYTAMLDAQGQMQWAWADMEVYAGVGTAAHLHRMQEAIAQAQFICADLNLPQTLLTELSEHCAAQARPLVLVAVSEAKMRHLPAHLHGVDALLLNAGELQACAASNPAASPSLQELWHALAARGLKHIVVTAGARNVYWGQSGTADSASPALSWQCLPVPPLPAERVRDATGAGDAFAAAFAAARYAQGLSMPEACAAGVARAQRTLQTTDTVWDGDETSLPSFAS